MTSDGATRPDEPSGGPVEKAAESISEGLPIPEHLAHSGDPHIDRVVENLRFIQRIHQIHAEPGEHDAAADTPANAPPRPRPAPETEPALFTWGHLRALELLGHGTSSEVYRAWDPRLQIEVALKLRRRTAFSTESRSFLDEARRMAQMRHPNILRVHGADEHDGREGIWMDLVRGKTLKQYVAEHGVLGAREAAVMGMEVCGALAALHDAGLVHRDVKPSNVMRGAGGHIVLMDLGSASAHKLEGADVEDLGGTPLTMAPEVVLDNQLPGPAADLYGVGVLLYFLATGRYPIEAATWEALADKHRRRIVTPLLDLRPDAPAAFVSVVERALRRRPEDRFATAGDLHQALASAIGATGTGRDQDQPPAPPFPPIRLLLGLAAALLVAGGVWAAVWYRGATAFDPACRLLRTSAAGSLPLADAAVIRPGDQLHVELRVNKTAYAWVFAEDDDATPVVLFPEAPGAGNRLQGTGVQRLPAPVNSGKIDHWVVTPGTRSQIVVVVCSRQPVPVADSLAAALIAPRVAAVNPDASTRNERGLAAPAAGSPHRDRFVLDDFIQRFGTGTGVYTARFFLRYDRPDMD